MEVHADYNQIPVFVKEGGIIPLAKPVLSVKRDTVFEMEVKIFGEGDGKFVLYGDDFETFDYEENLDMVILEKRPGQELVITRKGNPGYSFQQ